MFIRVIKINQHKTFFSRCQTGVYLFHAGSYKGQLALSVHVFALSRSEVVHGLSQNAARTSLHWRPAHRPALQFPIMISKPRRLRAVRATKGRDKMSYPCSGTATYVDTYASFTFKSLCLYRRKSCGSCQSLGLSLKHLVC